MTEAGLFTGRGSGAGLLLNITDGSCLRLYRARWQIPRVAPGARGCAREAASVGAAARARLEDGEEAARPRGPGSAGFAACPRPGPAASRAPDAWRAAADPTPGRAGGLSVASPDPAPAGTQPPVTLGEDVDPAPPAPRGLLTTAQVLIPACDAPRPVGVRWWVKTRSPVINLKKSLCG